MIIGDQTPRIRIVPDGVSHPDGEAVLELVDACGIKLDVWQQDLLRDSLLVRDVDDDRWAMIEVGVMLSRQNGKSELVLARLLGGAYILREPLLVYTAHLADTAKEMFRRLDDITESKRWLRREVKHVWRTNGHESLELDGGIRIRFRTRTKGGGRGYAGVSFVAFDEAMDIPTASHAAILPVVSAGLNPQVWYLGSAVDQLEHEDGVVFANVRERALAGEQRLGYSEWSIGQADGTDYPSPSAVPRPVATDPAVWAKANPAFNIRVMADMVANEQRSFIRRTFAVERLGVGDWPQTDVEPERKIDLAVWKAQADPHARMVGRPCLAFDVSPERSAAIAAAGMRAGGGTLLDVIEHRPGTRWLAARLLELVAKHDPVAVVCDSKGPAGSLLDELEALGVKVEDATASEHARGCGQLVDFIDDRTVWHLGTDELDAAVAGAATRPLGEAWAWSRQSSRIDIVPLVAVTLALWGFGAFADESEPMVAFR